MLGKRAAAKASAFLNEYSINKGIYMKINYFNADHTHALIDLRTRYSIEEVIQLFKGGSSYWINHNQMIRGKFAWRPYGIPRPGRSWLLNIGPSGLRILLCDVFHDLTVVAIECRPFGPDEFYTELDYRLAARGKVSIVRASMHSNNELGKEHHATGVWK
jgi:hypothetical protein